MRFGTRAAADRMDRQPSHDATGERFDVSAWLNALGMGQYRDAFAARVKDRDTLITLTARDLKRLGVDLLSHRRKLLAAIALVAQGKEPYGRLPGDDLPP